MYMCVTNTTYNNNNTYNILILMTIHLIIQMSMHTDMCIRIVCVSAWYQ